jgi:hypothetical protein
MYLTYSWMFGNCFRRINHTYISVVTSLNTTYKIFKVSYRKKCYIYFRKNLGMLCEYDNRNSLGGKMGVIDLVIELSPPVLSFLLESKAENSQ